MSRARTPEIRGHAAPGFEPVRDAFAANFGAGREIGAACAVCHRGELVVDLWAGLRDGATGAPWERDTLVGVFSVSKAVCALAMALLHSRRLLDFDRPIAHYWPEFAQHGKDRITVRQLLSHQAGLCAIDAPLTPGLLADPDAMSDLLARQRPLWEPGTRHGYHAVSLGFFQSELVRRTDPQRRTIGRFIRDELAAPLGEEFIIGAPRDLPEERIARLHDFPVLDLRPDRLIGRLRGMPLGLILTTPLPWSLAARSFLNPKLARPADLFRPPLRHVEVPSGNGVGTPRAVARMLGAFAAGGAPYDLQQRTLDELEAPARIPPAGEYDRVVKTRCRYGPGVTKPFPGFEFGTSGRAYGAPGLGGAIGVADPDTQTGYAYAPNRMGLCIFNDPREVRIREAVYRCLGARPGTPG